MSDSRRVPIVSRRERRVFYCPSEPATIQWLTIRSNVARLSGCDADQFATEFSTLPQNVEAGPVKFAGKCLGFQVPPVR